MNTPMNTPLNSKRTKRTAAWRIVAEREIRTKLASKAFRIGFGITCLLALVGSILMGRSMDQAPEYTMAVDSSAAKTLAETSRSSLGPDAELQITVYDDRAAAEQAVKDGKAEIALVASGKATSKWDLVGDDQIPAQLGAALSGAVANSVLGANAAEQKVDLEQLMAGTTPGEVLLGTNAEESGARMGVAFVMSLLFYFVALLFGMQIAQSVVEEKESRVVEILAAATDTRALLWGKIAGNSLLALAEVVGCAALAVAGFLITGRGDFLAGVGPSMAWFVVFFVLGFVALAALWSAAGAMVSRVADLGASTLPMQVLLLGGYMLGAFGTGLAAKVASFVPVISAMVMPSRIAQGGVPLWQVLIALAINALAVFVLVRIGARVYDRGLLRTDSKMSIKEALTAA